MENVKNQTAKSTYHPHKIDDEHDDRECKTEGGAYCAFSFGSDNPHTTHPKIPPDKEGLLWGWCVVCGPPKFPRNFGAFILVGPIKSLKIPAKFPTKF